MLIPKYEKACSVGNGKQQRKMTANIKEARLARKYVNFCMGHTTLTMARAFPFLGSFSNKGLPERHYKKGAEIFQQLILEEKQDVTFTLWKDRMHTNYFCFQQVKFRSTVLKFEVPM